MSSELLREWHSDYINYDAPSSQELVEEFHQVFGHPINVPITPELAKFRMTLIVEETEELFEEAWQCAQENRIRPNLLKEIADLRYVLSGLCVTLGIDEEECVRRVHESNMSKLGADGKPIYRKDGKVMKGPNYKEPDFTDMIASLPPFPDGERI